MSGTLRKRERILLVIPIGLFVLAVLLVNHQGPYYLGRNFDPEYCYLFNALNILEFQAPGHTDHPGTTLQLLGAVVVLAKWLPAAAFGFAERLDVSVLSHPEEYLLAMNLALNLIVCSLLFYVPRQILRTTGSLAPALALQVGWLVFIRPLEAHLRVSPEPLLMAVVLAMALLLVPALFGREPEAAVRSAKTAFLMGAVFGFGVVTKVTFIPLGALVLVLPGWRQKLRFALATVVSSAVFLFPIWSELGKVTTWLVSLATHTGRYGGGREGLPTLQEYLNSATWLLRQEPFVYLFLVLFAGLIPLSVFRGRRLCGAHERTDRRWWIGTVVATSALIAITSKHPAAHYILPVIVLAPVQLAVLTERLRGKTARWNPERLLAGGVALMVVAGLVNHWKSVDFMLDVQHFYRLDLAAQQRVIEQMPDCRVIGLYRSSVPTFALDFGNNYAEWRHTQTLQSLHPGNLIYSSHWGGLRKFQGFDRESKNEDVARQLDEGACLLLQGEWDRIRNVIGFRFEPLSPTDKSEVVVRLTSASQMQAEYSPPEGALILEAEEYAERQNVWAEDTVIASGSSNAAVVYRFDLREGGRREMLLRYSSGGGCPMRVQLNGETVTASAGAAEAEEMMWERIGVYEFAAGPNELRLERDGWFPSVDKIVLTPGEGPSASD